MTSGKPISPERTNFELPHVTVATVVVQDSRFLMVEETPSGAIDNTPVFNQPAGHLENGENLKQAAIRETLEETAWHVRLEAFLGIYQYQAPSSASRAMTGITYVRHCFIASVDKHDPHRGLDPDISAVHWFNYEEVLSRKAALRSPLVLKCIDDYLQGQRFPLSICFN